MSDEIETEETEDLEVETTEETDEQEIEESEGQDVEETEEDDDESDTPEDKPRKKKNGFQERINEVTADKYKYKYEAEAWKEKAEFYASQQQVPEATPQDVIDNTEPQPEDYETNAEYSRAQTRWEVHQEFAKKDVERAKKNADEDAQREKEEINTSYKQRAQEAIKKYPDFVDTVKSAKIDVKSESLELIMTSEFGPDIAYHLAKNPEDADRFSKLSTTGAAKMIGRLEAKFDNKPIKKVKKKTKAHDPITGIKTKTNVSSKDQKDLPMAEYIKSRSA